jgi:hypothetical protein
MHPEPASTLLVLLIGDTDPGRLREAIASRPEPPTRVHVVAPTVVGPLAWLATAEDAAHREAETRVLEAEWMLADDLAVEGEAEDADPIQAVEDALRAFPADAILIAGEAADGDLEGALRRFGLPVSRLDGPPGPRRSRLYRSLRGLAGGHSPATPFVLFVGVNAALVALGALLSLLVLLILWLSGNL